MKAAGSLNEPLLLLQPQQSIATDGTVTRSYQQVAMVWASVKLEPGRETNTAGRMSALYPITILMRRRTDITEGWRIERDGSSLRVKAVEAASAAQPFMQVFCENEEGADGGT